MTDTVMSNTATILKSYLSAEEREELLKGDINLLYISESMEAGAAGNDDDAWAWISRAELPATSLLRVKRSLGAKFIRDMNFNTKLADEAYGADWLDSGL